MHLPNQRKAGVGGEGTRVETWRPAHARMATMQLHHMVTTGEYSTLFVARLNNEHNPIVVKCFSRAHVETRTEDMQRVVHATST